VEVLDEVAVGIVNTGGAVVLVITEDVDVPGDEELPIEPIKLSTPNQWRTVPDG
jgi:hypothetical protein